MKYILYCLLLSFNFVCAQGGKVVYDSYHTFSTSDVVTSNLYFSSSSSIFINDKSSEKDDSDSNSNKKEEIKLTKNSEVNVDQTIEKTRSYSYADDALGNRYYNDLQNNEFLCREPVFDGTGLKFFTYKDDLAGKIKWKLENDFKEISGYNCQKAVGQFRGRTYTAWFTPKIPLPYGPWKLGGLPGLILEVYDESKDVYYSAVKIEIPYTVEEYLQKPNDVKEIGHKEFVAKNNKIKDEITRSVLARLPKGATLKSVNVEKSESAELKYEWETE